MNQFLETRLSGLLGSLQVTALATTENASATKGHARASFINSFLANIIPPSLRISQSGQITDKDGNITGELDVVIENGQFPSIPVSAIDDSKVFFAEGVAAVIEVKSNLVSQWEQVLKTSEKVATISRKYKGGISFKNNITQITIPGADFSKANLGRVEPSYLDVHVPFFVVGYKGWPDDIKLLSNLNQGSKKIYGILQIEEPRFVGFTNDKIINSRGTHALLAFLKCIHEVSSAMQIAVADIEAYF
jgi:hypothetical protein